MTARKVNIISLIILAVFLLATEFYLRLNNSKPGFIYSNLTEVDSLVVYPFYFADDSGVERLSPYATALINGNIQHEGKFNLDSLKKFNLEDDLFNLVMDFYLLRNNFSADSIEKLRKQNGVESSPEEKKEFDEAYNNSAFRKRFRLAFSKKNKDSFDSLLIDYVNHPINQSGFHSIDFSKALKGKKRILLMGNSFAYGRDAKPLYNSYADILLSRGYLIFNCSIVSTDVTQFYALLNKYIDSIKPDVVLITASVNNRISFEHEPAAGRMLYHHTNAGLLSSYPLGYYMNPQEAYRYALLSCKIPKTNLFNRFCSLTSITSKLWVSFNNHHWVNNNEPALAAYYARSIPAAPFPVHEKYYKRVIEKCREKKVKFLLTVIPDFFNYYDHYPQLSNKEVFKNIPYREPDNLLKSDYATQPGDDHLNNSGHKKYADFLESVMRDEL